jgi:hypothetical protein
MANGKQKVKLVKDETSETQALQQPIEKPSGKFDLNKFKSKQVATVANVETLPTSLPVHNMAAAKDLVRLHPDEEAYW